MKLKKYFLLNTGLVLTILACICSEGEGRAGYADSQACIECHEEAYDNLKIDPHMITSDPGRPGAGYGCESCHGPGRSHVESGDVEDILVFGNRSLHDQKMKNDVCLRCHDSGKLSLWYESEHDARGISCTDCHKIHKGDGILSDNSNDSPMIEKCLKCHARIRSQLMRQSRHPICEGKIKCMDCHNPHGSLSEKLIDAQSPNLKCFECHEEKRGPFLWEHPSSSEDCLACHTPHGSTHGPLLNSKMPWLCQRCHSDEVHSGTLYAKNPAQQNQSIYRAGSSAVFYRACLNCHVSIHGSNHPSGKSLLR